MKTLCLLTTIRQILEKNVRTVKQLTIKWSPITACFRQSALTIWKLVSVVESRGWVWSNIHVHCMKWLSRYVEVWKEGGLNISNSLFSVFIQLLLLFFACKTECSTMNTFKKCAPLWPFEQFLVSRPSLRWQTMCTGFECGDSEQLQTLRLQMWSYNLVCLKHTEIFAIVGSPQFSFAMRDDYPHSRCTLTVSFTTK